MWWLCLVCGTGVDGRIVTHIAAHLALTRIPTGIETQLCNDGRFGLQPVYQFTSKRIDRQQIMQHTEWEKRNKYDYTEKEKHEQHNEPLLRRILCS